MLTKKLLAAVGLAGALLLGAASDASANPWHRPYFRPGPVYRGPVYGPTYPAPVYGPVYRPAYRGVYWRHHMWAREHGWRRW